jgi:hypothetical protein
MASHSHYFEECEIEGCPKQLNSEISICSCQKKKEVYLGKCN